ncbi:MAG: hypothetical protein QMB94_06640, partial [Phycisphaerales bacterium]
MPMSLNSGSASGILQGSRYNRGAGTAGTGATHASTVDTGSVLRIETNKTNGIILYCRDNLFSSGGVFYLNDRYEPKSFMGYAFGSGFFDLALFESGTHQ